MRLIHPKTIAGGALIAAIGAAALAAQPPAAPAPKPKLKEVESPGANRDHASAYRTDVVDVPIPADGEIEYMVRMKAGDALTYAWEAQGGTNFWHEFHGHTPDTVSFYKKADGPRHQGSFVAPFEGIHGWYFLNNSTRPVVVKVRLSGFYELIPR